MSAQTHTELYVWPHRYQVQEGAYHALVILLVQVFTFLIRVKCCSRTNQHRHSFGVLHLEFPHNVLGVLGLVHKVPSLDCLIRRPRKNSNSPIMLISNFMLMSNANLETKEYDQPKIISSTYI
jgi:hypothetical protein